MIWAALSHVDTTPITVDKRVDSERLVEYIRADNNHHRTLKISACNTCVTIPGCTLELSIFSGDKVYIYISEHQL